MATADLAETSPDVGAAGGPRLAALLRPHLGSFAAVVILQVIGAVAGLAPLLAVVEPGRVLLSPGPVDHGHVWFVVLAGAAGLFVRLVCTAASSGIGHLLDDQVQLSFRRQLAARLGRVPIGWFSRRRTGELAKVVGEDVSAVHPFIAHTPGELVSAFVVPLVSLTYLFTIDWRLTLITLIPVALAVALVPLMMTPTRLREQKEFDGAMGRIASSVVEFVQGISVVKAFGGAKRAHHKFLTAADDFVGTFLRWVRGMSGIAARMQLALSPPFVLLVVLVGGAALITTGGMAPADLLPFLLLGLGADPLLSLAEFGGKLRGARTELARLDTVLRTAPLPEPREPIQPERHDLEFESVAFQHGDRTVIDDVSLSVPEGQRLAVVGPSGAGKSTLLQLLARFYDVDAGAVRVGGVDVRAIDTEVLMARIAIVFQDVYLFDGTIEENVRLGRPDADEAEVRAAAAAARLDEVIERLPAGWATNVGEGGALLSGGERQRVSIARALLKNAPIVLLDEVTSALDPVNEAAVHEGIERLMEGRTVVMVAHRMWTVQRADRVVFLDGGRIVEEGSHDELLRHGGPLRRFLGNFHYTGSE